jgi:hypothetical protein
MGRPAGPPPLLCGSWNGFVVRHLAVTLRPPAHLPAPLPGDGNYAILKSEFCLPQFRGRGAMTTQSPAFSGPGRVEKRVEPVSGAAKLIEPKGKNMQNHEFLTPRGQAA